MPIQELLAQLESAYEALQSENDEALAEVVFLRACLAASRRTSSHVVIDSLRADVETAQLVQQFSFEALHGAPPADGDSGRESRKSNVVGRTTLGLGRGGGTRMTLPFMTDSSSKESYARNQEYLNPAGASVQMWQLPEGNSLSDRIIRFLRHPFVETLLILVVISNVVIIVYETDRLAEQNKRLLILEVLGWIYLLVYLLEFILRVVAYRTLVFVNKWNRLDFAVVAIDILTVSSEAIWGDELLGGVNASMFRLLRAFRLVKVFKVLRFVKELQLLIHGFAGAMRAVVWATGMLEVMVAIWSLIYVEVLYPRVLELSESGKFKQCEHCARYEVAYSSFWNAHITIWQQVIAGDSWGLLSVEVMTEFPVYALLYIGCLMSIQFAMLNLIFTVIVDAAIRAREEDHQQRIQEKDDCFQGMRRKLEQICMNMDTDCSGELTLDELLEGYRTNQEFSETMAALDISLDDISSLFTLMDEDRSGAVSYKEFVNNIYKMKEQDMHTMLMFIKGYVMDMRFKLKKDVTSLLRENLRQSQHISDRISQHMQVMMHRVEQLPKDIGSFDGAIHRFESSDLGNSWAGGERLMEPVYDDSHQHMEATPQHVETCVAGSQNASDHQHRKATGQHAEDTGVGIRTASAHRHTGATVQHAESPAAETRNATGLRHTAATVKRVEDVAVEIQNASNYQHMKAMGQHVEDFDAGIGITGVRQHMEAMVQHVEDLAAEIRNATGWRHMEAMLKRVEDLVASFQSLCSKQYVTTPAGSSTKEISFILESQVEILRALQKKKRPQTNTLALHSAAQPATAPHLAVQHSSTVQRLLEAPKKLSRYDPSVGLHDIGV